jgi:site-specific recombinase XerD
MDYRELLDLEQPFLKSLKKQGKSDNSLKSYRLDLRCFYEFLDERENHQVLKNFNSQSVELFQDFLSGRYQNINSVRRKLQTLRTFFDYLVISKHYPENPLRKIIVGPKHVYPPTPASTLALNQFIEAIAMEWDSKVKPDVHFMNSYRNLLIFQLVYFAGLKVSDLINLCRQDLILPSGGLAPRVLIRPKKRDPYSIPLDQIEEGFITRYLHLLDQLNLPGKALFFNSNAHAVLKSGLTARGVENIFEKLSSAAGLTENITPKVLRQSCVTRWLSLDKNIGQIKEWLGVAPSYDLSPFRKVYQTNTNQWNFLETDQKLISVISTINQ